ncbi:MAG: hypothetical protein L6R38_004912 [Xanthoria sp. 2 TBL-2021]|nr:MAG: hypothetical protein L6R38_004912 [Xanthoria sp. 2 TBL-2021]
MSRRLILAILEAVVKFWEKTCRKPTTDIKNCKETLDEQNEFLKTVKFVVWIDGLFRPEREALKAELKALEYWAAKDPEWSKAAADCLPDKSEAPLSINTPALNAGDYYIRDLEALFRKELDKVKSRVNDPDVPMLARMQRFARLGRTQNEFKRWKAQCRQRRLSETKSTEIRTVQEQDRFLRILKRVMKRDSWSINPLWTAQERVDRLTVRKAVEDKVQEDPRHSKAFD